MSLEDLVNMFGNQNDSFTFEATNIDGIFKYLQAVS